MSGTEPSQEVSAQLRQIREARGRRAREVAHELGWNASKLSRIENAKSRVMSADLAALLDLYGADDTIRSRLTALLAGDPAAGSAGAAVPAAYGEYATLERTAERISMYAAAVVPGLLQIPEYAAAVIDATPEPEPELAEERLSLRLQRQAVFTSPVALDVIIDEAVLRRPVGSADIMRRQMIRLGEFVERPSTTIRVLPLAVGAHPAVTGQFAILDFAAAAATPPHVFCDGLTGGVLRHLPDEVHRYRACFAALQELALSAQESAEIFAATP
ncbi:helix-turn-helix domain-containing protein [Dactylosporangium vinaceum]|uniref:Helix-turn-helix domain-containing protein n=1 Tax=Dactylosporangium vinaceum TaxID=53362 RepID=A0ABV5MJ05_9ACTN|nr:helix-turn-helix transcriptional regulator [Dactylosporangium vinaceum]UAB93705.1 helix-turn-helix domain-containing protein [Dactylosporangium vinaceum]